MRKSDITAKVKKLNKQMVDFEDFVRFIIDNAEKIPVAYAVEVWYLLRRCCYLCENVESALKLLSKNKNLKKELKRVKI